MHVIVNHLVEDMTRLLVPSQGLMTREGSPLAYTIASSEIHDDNQLCRVVKYGIIEVVWYLLHSS